MAKPNLARLNPHEALISAMVLMAACDQHMSDAELAMMTRLVQELPAFQGFDPAEIAVVTEACMGVLEEKDGLERAYGLLRQALPVPLRETAYLLACEVAAADGEATQEELHFLQDLRIGLDLDRLVAGAIERAARARFQRVETPVA